MILPTYQIKIYLSGPIEVAKQIIREHLVEHPLCVTIEPTTFIYTGGEETGYVVGLLNYPRFPTAPNELAVRAGILANLLLERTFQRSALLVTPEQTTWINPPPTVDPTPLSSSTNPERQSAGSATTTTEEQKA